MKEMKNKALNNVKQTPIQVPDADLMQLADKIAAVVEMGKQHLAISINQTIKSTYWNVGRHIVEFEQQGNARAKYGQACFHALQESFGQRWDEAIAVPI